MAKIIPISVRKALEAMDGKYRMIGNDVDSIKHLLRGVQWRLDAVVNHFKIAVQPDALEAIVNPSASFINDIVRNARFVGESEPVAKAKKKRLVRKKRR